MSNYHSTFYHDPQIKTLLDDTDRESYQRSSSSSCRTTLIYGSGSRNTSLGIPMEEMVNGSQEHGGMVKKVVPCSCLIYKMRGEHSERYSDIQNVYSGTSMNYDDEFIVDISSGESSSCFLTSKGRVFTSANSENHNSSKVPTFIALTYSDVKVNTNVGMIAELNLEEVQKMERDIIGDREGYIFGVKQVCTLSCHLALLTQSGLVWLLSKANHWKLIKFCNEQNELVRINYLTCGLSHIMALSEERELFVASQYDTYGASGSSVATSNAFDVAKPFLPLESGDSILDVYAAYYRTLVVTKLGRLYVTGWGVFSQQGLGDNTENITKFTLHEPMLKTGEKVVKVSLGALHTVCLCESGNCWVFGYNTYSQCGAKKTTDNIPYPVKLETPTKIKDIFCGWHFSILQTVDGTFLGAGSNSAGELASIDRDLGAITQFSPVQLPNLPITGQIMWRLFTTSFSSNVFYMARLESSKRTQWMKQNMKNLTSTPNNLHPLFDIVILH